MVATLRSHTRHARLKKRGLPVPAGLAVARWLTGLLVVRKLRKLGGGRIRLIVSGAAPLEKRLANVFRALGFNLLEGYGLTETSPVACAAVPGQERVGTVGRPLPGVEVRIGPDDEVFIRGPNVMRGYLNKPEETARAIDPEGWLHTGDQGRFDDAGNLVITGRIKELIVNSYGKNIPPVPVEQALMTSKYVEQAVVIGDRRPFLSALIVPGRIILEDWARGQNLRYPDYAGLLALPPVLDLFKSEVAKAVANLAPYEQVKQFCLIPEPCTVENGLLTPTLKVRRGKVAEAYRETIESMYRECR
jgi:long-chain acyl-CoA synthetase